MQRTQLDGNGSMWQSKNCHFDNSIAAPTLVWWRYFPSGLTTLDTRLVARWLLVSQGTIAIVNTSSSTAVRYCIKYCILGLSAAWVAIFPSGAQDSHFGSIAFPEQTSAQGYTGGTTSLPAVLGNKDENENLCLGFGDPMPDYILILDRDVDRLQLQVDSGGRDTTLLVRDIEEETLYCADDTDSGVDAGMTLDHGSSGRYKIWIGTSEPGKRWDYTLSVQP